MWTGHKTMHCLSRQVRFSINPFVPVQTGFNSYASKPCGAGLSYYLALWVELASALDPDTGFVVNVSQIDRAVRSEVIGLFDAAVREAAHAGRGLSVYDLCVLMRTVWSQIARVFSSMRLERLALELNPYRTIQLNTEESDMYWFSEKFEFAAMHRLWNAKYDTAANMDFFGKCANPAGHGHNYVIEVTVEKPTRPEAEDWVARFEQVVEDAFLSLVDHKNLNVDVPGFEKLNPTVENLSSFAWSRLLGKFTDCRLVRVTVWENDRTYCAYSE
jgi:6-pyruvoyltetrahydropterin/6-carboxytetrahydropterin synthase